MRRMITNKQIDDIEQGAVLDQYIKPSAPIPPLPEAPDVLVFNQYIDDFVKGVETEDYSVNFETHDITAWYPTIEDQNHVAQASFETSDSIAFPDEIETVEDLAAWIKENWQTIIYNAVLEDKAMYLESINAIVNYASIQYDNESVKYESDGIHADVTAVEYIPSQLKKLKLSFGVDGNLKINGIGEIDSNQKITTTSNILCKDLVCSNSVSCKTEITTPKIDPAKYGGVIELGHTKLTFLLDANNTSILNVGLMTVGRIEPREDNLVLYRIPTSDPHVTGAVWNDNGTLKISSGH